MVKANISLTETEARAISAVPNVVGVVVVDYQVVEGDTVAALRTAVLALVTANQNWQPLGTSYVHSHGGSDFFHQTMVRYG